MSISPPSESTAQPFYIALSFPDGTAPPTGVPAWQVPTGNQLVSLEVSGTGLSAKVTPTTSGGAVTFFVTYAAAGVSASLTVDLANPTASSFILVLLATPPTDFTNNPPSA